MSATVTFYTKCATGPRYGPADAFEQKPTVFPSLLTQRLPLLAQGVGVTLRPPTSGANSSSCVTGRSHIVVGCPVLTRNPGSVVRTPRSRPGSPTARDV